MIPRYKQIGTYNALEQMPDGAWCSWPDVEALQKQNDELRAQALAAVWLISGETPLRDLLQLRDEASEVFLGKDKQTIAQLQDEVRHAQEALLHVQHPPAPGINGVYGVKHSSKYYPDRYMLMITKLNRAPNGGLEIEVQLP